MNKTDVAYNLLRARIADGTYPPGHRLIVDQIARESGISVIPWREAIRLLEAQGWIEMEHNFGARVAVFDREALTQTVFLLARLEGLATATALLSMSAAAVDAARTVNDRMKSELRHFDPQVFMELNRDFHFVFYDHCGDSHLRDLIANEWSRLEIIRRPVYALAPGRARASIVEHDQLIELLRPLDASSWDAVELAARQHKLNSLHAVTEPIVTEVESDLLPGVEPLVPQTP